MESWQQANFLGGVGMGGGSLNSNPLFVCKKCVENAYRLHHPWTKKEKQTKVLKDERRAVLNHLKNYITKWHL